MDQETIQLRDDIAAKFASLAPAVSPSFSGEASFADGATMNGVLTAQLTGQPAFLPPAGFLSIPAFQSGGRILTKELLRVRRDSG
jgi:hypothetical protein